MSGLIRRSWSILFNCKSLENVNRSYSWWLKLDHGYLFNCFRVLCRDYKGLKRHTIRNQVRSFYKKFVMLLSRRSRSHVFGLESLKYRLICNLVSKDFMIFARERFGVYKNNFGGYFFKNYVDLNRFRFFKWLNKV